MKKLFVIFVCLFMFYGCSENVDEPKKEVANVNRITCADVNGLVNEGAILIDVRTSEEYNTDHIENAINVNSETIKYTIKKYVDDYNTPVIVYCQSGRRSAKSADILVNLGYTKVYDMGGIIGCYGEE